MHTVYARMVIQEKRAYSFSSLYLYYLKDLFKDLNIISYVKTSRKTGLHIFVPIISSYTYDQTRRFAEIIGNMLVKTYPDKITMEWKTIKRKGKVFFDHNQKSKGKTIASIYSVRQTASATVSMPIEWKELSSIVPTDFNTQDLETSIALSIRAIVNGYTYNS